MDSVRGSWKIHRRRAGNLVNGELDSNSLLPTDKAVALAFTGTYSIGSDGRGVMNLSDQNPAVLVFEQ